MKAVEFHRNGEPAVADSILPTDVFHMHDIDTERVLIYYLSRGFYCQMKGLPYMPEDGG